MPADPLKAKLRSVIRNLAEEFGAPEFDPHVTIWAGPSDRNKVQAATGDITSQWGSLDLRMRKLDQSDLYTKTFFIQFDHSDALHRISDHILSSVGASGDLGSEVSLQS